MLISIIYESKSGENRGYSPKLEVNTKAEAQAMVDDLTQNYPTLNYSYIIIKEDKR